MKKILFLTGGLGNGGAERVALTLADGLSNKGYLVEILYFREDKNPYSTKCHTRMVKKGDFLTTELYLRQCVKEAAPDVIIAFEYHTAVKCILATGFQKHNYRIISSERGDPYQLRKKKMKGWDFLRNYAYKKCDLVVCQTRDAKSYFSAEIQKHTVVIPNPVRNIFPEWESDQCENSVITFCRLEKQKNIPLLIQAFEQMLMLFPNYKLYIFGNGSEERKIRNEIKEKNLRENVILQDFSSDIHKIAVKSRLFVSSSDYEGISNSMLEAMAMGMPVVCTDCPVGGAGMIIRNYENGILVPVGDSTRLAEAMIEIISDSALASRLGDNAKRIKRELSVEGVLQRWIKLLEEK